MLTSLLAAFLSTSIPVVQATEAVTNAAMPSVAVHRVLYPFRPGVVFGLGFGLSVPAGTYTIDSRGRTTAMSDISANLWRGELQLGYQLSPPFYLGGHFAMEFGGAGDSVEAECSRRDLSCSVQNIAFGLDAEYRFLPDRLLSPWIGVGVASETLSLKRRRGSFKADLQSYGIDGNFALGVDVHVSRGFTVGPCVVYRLGTFFSTQLQSTLTGIPDAQTVVQQIPSDTIATDTDLAGGVHHWLGFVLRGRLYAGES